ncbi:MAG: B12-binding domain-containing radical SAM protein, partial [Candidatus Omnitrophica bacterium]|nr:B12-binding domain-containing radical SAM protein [Candidatus Omnitrophota bacterium]
MEKKPDILLVYPTFRNETFYHLKFDWHLGSSYILAYLKTRAVHALQFIQKEPIGMDRLIEQLLSYSPKIIGFTCYDVNYFFVKLISQELKKRRKDITIVAGGPTATFSDELILRDARAIDVCVRGEGEQAVAEIIDHVNGKTEIGGIKGISYRRKGSIVRNPDRPSLRGKGNSKALDIFPSPYLTGILPPDGRIGILTSRGCVYHCTYCSFSAMSGWKVSYHSTERVLSELRIISEARNKPRSQQNLVSIHDDAFSLNTQRAKEICRRIIKENVSLPLWCETRGDRVDEELLGLMKKANFRIISFGLESAVPENLRIIKKVVSDKTADRALSRERVFIDKIEAMTNRAKELGMNVTLSVIVG